MSWGSFITGAITALFMYALFTSDKEYVEEIEEVDGEEIEINDFHTRHVTISCQTCRKLKRHKEVKPNLFQCVKCKRHTDLRAS
jgi:acetyl-CoA carboxylase beta subunit